MTRARGRTLMLCVLSLVDIYTPSCISLDHAVRFFLYNQCRDMPARLSSFSPSYQTSTSTFLISPARVLQIYKIRCLSSRLLPRVQLYTIGTSTLFEIGRFFHQSILSMSSNLCTWICPARSTWTWHIMYIIYTNKLFLLHQISMP